MAKAAPEKIVVKKAPARAVPEKAAAKKTVAKAAPKKSAIKKLSSKKDEGESIESLIDKRDIDLKSIDEALGLNKYDATKDHPLIPGKFDMIIPPGTPRKIIVNMAKEFNLEVAQETTTTCPSASATSRESCWSSAATKKPYLRLIRNSQNVLKPGQSRHNRHDGPGTPRGR